MFRKIKYGIMSLLGRSPIYEPISKFVSPCQNLIMAFGTGWEWEVPKQGETTFTFFNNEVEDILYCSVLSNEDKNYKYNPNRSLEINENNTPVLLNLTKYKAVLYTTQEKNSDVFYRHYEIGHNQT